MITQKYNQAALEKDLAANCGRPYQQCSMSVMDTIADPNITFDENGVCNYYHEYKKAEETFVFDGEVGKAKLEQGVQQIKADKKNKKYDSILGLSGGVDSTYLCLLVKQLGLNPLVVHCDNGWNSELAVNNIESTVNTLGLDLFTYVIDWAEFRNMQMAYLKASVVDIEVLTDHAFMAVLYEQARKWEIKHVIIGTNIVTENVLPSYWIYSKQDTVNIKDINTKYGIIPTQKLKSFPFLSHSTQRYVNEVLKIQRFEPLNLIHYNYDEVKETIKRELGWRDYGGKHYESVWTRFYQGYILPSKFNIDKRKAHLSNLIFSGQITKEQAIEKLGQTSYPPQLLEDDMTFILKKFNLTKEQFEAIMQQPRREHTDFAVQKGLIDQYPILKIVKKIRDIFRNA
jgi:N-acetyl sugar amidotransferase